MEAIEVALALAGALAQTAPTAIALIKGDDTTQSTTVGFGIMTALSQVTGLISRYGQGTITVEDLERDLADVRARIPESMQALIEAYEKNVGPVPDQTT
jgi:hypothetical protein